MILSWDVDIFVIKLKRIHSKAFRAIFETFFFDYTTLTDLITKTSPSGGLVRANASIAEVRS
jgi:hypothetical protein